MAKVFGVHLTGLFYVFFIILLTVSNHFVAAKFQQIEEYEVYSSLPNINPTADLVKLRAKRQALTDNKNQYQSVTQNGTTSVTGQPQVEMAKGQSTPNINGDDSVVVNYNASEHRLLGENGTGQRRYPLDDPTKQQPTVIATDNLGATQNEGRKLGMTGVVGVAETSAEQLADKVDVPENETLTELEHQGYKVNQTTDFHSYYNSTIYVDKAEASQIWEAVHKSSINGMLSQAHRRAMTVELKFDFPFYGHPVRNITVATGGFLYTGEYVHSWLAATQYIAPLMANFDTSISNDSFVRLNDNGTAFTVLWENVSLQDKPEVGKFTFSTTLFNNGDIVCTYFSVPIFVNSIQDDKHPVKVGLSDAYIIDKIVFFARRKTIYEYHRVNFANVQITNSTIIRLVALPTCITYTDCEACINHKTAFDCAWCPVMNRCSSGTDRGKQEWLQRGCDRMQILEISHCPAMGTKGNNAANSNTTYTDYNITPNNNNNYNMHDHDKSHEGSDNEHNAGGEHITDDDSFHTGINDSNSFSGKSAKAAAAIFKGPAASSSVMNGENTDQAHSNMGVAMGILVPITLVVFLLAWVVYAYRHPHTMSGQLLIQYRPSTWSWRRGEARYTAATIHM